MVTYLPSFVQPLKKLFTKDYTTDYLTPLLKAFWSYHFWTLVSRRISSKVYDFSILKVNYFVDWNKHVGIMYYENYFWFFLVVEFAHSVSFSHSLLHALDKPAKTPLMKLCFPQYFFKNIHVFSDMLCFWHAYTCDTHIYL